MLYRGFTVNNGFGSFKGEVEQLLGIFFYSSVLPLTKEAERRMASKELLLGNKFLFQSSIPSSELLHQLSVLQIWYLLYT